MERYAIRADYDARSIVVYQAYSPLIALPAAKAQRFTPPFSLTRMTWIKPSFLWMMERSNWGRKSGQEHVLAVRISRTGWEEALSHAVLTSFAPGVYADRDEWQRQVEQARVLVQWDPERGLRGEGLPYDSIQVGISRHLIERYVNEWIQEIRDITPLVRSLATQIAAGEAQRARQKLPNERLYPVPDTIARRLGIPLTSR
ncbi:MAG: DUF4291 domain-containing protein [Ktedonobacterales bacterium]